MKKAKPKIPTKNSFALRLALPLLHRLVQPFISQSKPNLSQSAPPPLPHEHHHPTANLPALSIAPFPSSAQPTSSTFVLLPSTFSLLPALFLFHACFSLGYGQTLSTAFTAREPGRTHMDIGGVWNGTTDVSATQGDTFTLNIVNNATVRYEFDLTVTLPNHFQYLPGTASVASSCGAISPPVTASQTGTTLNFNFPAGYDLPANCTLTVTFDLRVASTLPSSGTYTIQYASVHSLTNGGPANQSVNTSFDILVLQGASNLQKMPTNQLRAVGENAVFTVYVTNSGLGALFDVTINESAINPGGNLSLISMVQTPSAPPINPRTATGSAPILTIPYLAPGEIFSVDVTATVTNCGNILNTVSTTDRTTFTAKSTTAPVLLNLQEPLIAYSPPNVTLSYNSTTNLSFTVNNTGLGAARGVRLLTNLHTLGVSVTNLASGWTYNAGIFTYGTPSTLITGVVPLSFDLEPLNVCTGAAGGTIIWRSDYTNTCGDPFTTPTATSTVAAPANAPTLTLSNTVSGPNILPNNAASSYLLTLAATQTNFINGTQFVVTDTIPANLTGITLTPSSGTANLVGNTITWTVPKVVPTTNATLTIGFTTPADPCAAGGANTAIASVPATSTRGCVLNTSAQAVYYLVTEGTGTTQSFTVATPPDGVYETGFNSTNNTIRELSLGEGEFIPFETAYDFAPGYPGTWTGSVYTDDFAGVATQVLIPSTAEYSINGGVTWLPIPGGSITNTLGSLAINLDFLTAAFGGNNFVSGKSIRLRYRTTIPDAGLNGLNQRLLTQYSNLTLANIGTPPGGACTVSGTNFRQIVQYSIARAAATIAVDIPSQFALCEVIPVTITVGNATAKPARNLLVTLTTVGTEYEYLTGQPPIYGGSFVGSIVYTENSGNNPTFQYTGTALTGPGTITVQVRRKATNPNLVAALPATVSYDSYQTSTTPARDYSTNASDQPFLTRAASLNLTITPNNVVVIGNTIEWKIYVTNGGDGPAYNATLRNTLPNDLEVNSSLTNAANPGYPVVVSGSSNEILTWALGDIPSGVTRTIRVIADITPSTGCSIPNGLNNIVAEWGCGSIIYQTTQRVAPDYTFPAGQLLVAHDTTTSVARLCEDGTVSIIIRNSGATEVYNITAREQLDPTTTGLSLIPGTVEYSTNGGVSWIAGGNPTGTGAIGDEYTWTSTQIPPLANLKPAGSSPQEVRIRFSISANATFAGSGNISALASATGSIACGNPVNSPGTGANIPTQRPNVSIEVTGRNITANPSASYTDSVFGGVGEQVEWRIVISNTGNQVARNVRFRQTFAGSGGSAVINGTGFSNTPFPNNTYFNLNNLTQPNNNLSPGSSVTYIVTETLGANCVPGTLTTVDVVWGCYPPNPITNLLTPGTPSDTATLDMVPSFTGGVTATQTVTSQPGGRARIDITLTNNDATAASISFTSNLSSGLTVDPSYTPTIAGTGYTNGGNPLLAITGISYSSPTFTLTGRLLNGKSVTITYYVYSSFQDTTAANITNAVFLNNETVANSLDPTLPADGTNDLDLTYSSTCGAVQPIIDFTSTIPLLTPDLDITTDPGNQVVAANNTFANYDFRIRNNGNAGNADAGSAANSITIRVFVGRGWTLDATTAFDMISTTTISPAFNADYGTPTLVGDYHRYDFTIPSDRVFPTSTNNDNNILVRIRAKVLPGNTLPLGIYLEVEGNVLDQSGADTGYNYSFDRRRPAIIGVDLVKGNAITNQTESTGTNMMIGEEATFPLSIRFFGGESGSNLSSIIVRDRLSDTNNNDVNNPSHNLLAYVSHAVNPANTSTISSTTFTPASMSAVNPAQNGRVDFNLANFDSATETKFAVDLTTRLLPWTNEATYEGRNIRNNFGVSFLYQGQTFRAADADLQFPSGTLDGDLDDAKAVVARRPGLTVSKTSRNLSLVPIPAFANTMNAQAGHLIEYRVIITNPGTRSVPLFDLQALDTLPAKLNLQDNTQIPNSAFADLNANGSYDAGTDVLIQPAGISPGLGGTLTINQTTLPITTLGSNCAQLNPGQSITLYYRAIVDASVTPNENLLNNIDVSGDTLPGASGNQTVNPGLNGEADGPVVIAVNDSVASLVIDSIVPSKTILATSAGNDTSADVLVGEQVRFSLTYTLPQGSIPNLKVTDLLPPGLALLETPAITLGSAISGGQPVITPASLPAYGNPLTIEWNFGTRTVSVAPEVDRSLTITYLTQVRNLAANTNGVTIQNNASYSFTGSPPNGSSVTLTVRTPTPVVTKTVSPTSNFDAGDTLTYTFTFDNTTGSAPAYDLAIADTLDNKTTFVPGSATVTEAINVTGAVVGPFHPPDVAGQTLTWGLNQTIPYNLDVGAGGKLVFTYQVTVNDTAVLNEIINNQILCTWTSLDGAPGPDLGFPLAAPGDTLGERTGSGAPDNTFFAQPASNATVGGAMNLLKSKSADTLPIDDPPGPPPPSDGFRIGDIITYNITITLPEGTHNNVEISDTLPAGLALVDFDPLSPPSGTPFTYTQPTAPLTAPSSGATGLLTWNLGTVVNIGDNNPANDTLTLVYRAQILDNLTAFPATPTTQNTANSAVLTRTDFNGSPHTTVPVPDGITIATIRQPLLTIAKALLSPGDATLHTGETARFRLTITNTGTAPAYNPTVIDTLPAGLRGATPILVTATLNGVDITSNAPTLNYLPLTGVVTWTFTDDTQYLLPIANAPNHTLVLTYDVTAADSPLNINQSNSAVVSQYFSKPSADPSQRRQYAALSPVSQTVIIRPSISGFVYWDIINNSIKDGSEDWTQGPTVYVNLVQGGTVIRTATVNPGTGAFNFTEVLNGNYTLVVTNGPSNPNPVVPANWFFRSPPSGSLPITVANANLIQQNFGLYTGSTITGLVFQDDGAGGGTANDGLQNGSEKGLPNVSVRLTDCGNTTYNTALTNGAGVFVLAVPVSITTGTNLCVVETNLANYTSTGGSAGDTGGTYSQSTDTISFTFTSGTNYTGLRFGDVPPSRLLTDGTQTIIPGATAFYSHQFIAGTAGNVVFSLATLDTPDLPWSTLLYLDSNGNGQIDAGEPVISGPIAVTAGQIVHLLVKDISPTGAVNGAQNRTTLTALLTYANQPALSETLSRQDLTILGQPQVAGLQLIKSVDKTTAQPGENITYTITYTNVSAGPIHTLIIYDQTPAFTTFVSASTGPLPPNLTAPVITAPSIGTSGSLTWTFGGTLLPGSSSTVIYVVKVDQ